MGRQSVEQRLRKVYLVFMDEEFRREVAKGFEKLGFMVVECDKTAPLDCPDPLETLTIIETGDDGALLSRLVYELYLTHGAEHTIPIIGIISPESMKMNSSLGWWLVNGHAAILLLIPREGDMVGQLMLVGRHILGTVTDGNQST